MSAISLSYEQSDEGVFTEQHVGDVELLRTPGKLKSEWFEVTVTQYARSASEATGGVRRGVGSYHHLGGRYFASQLTSAEARELAAFLLAADRRVDELDT
jgi:hypothetical protein